MGDHEVLFRSEKWTEGEPDFLPDIYDDVQEFILRYQGRDKEELLRRCREWEFFKAGPDPVYEQFWERFNGPTEYDPADQHLGVEASRRKVLDPLDPACQKFLKPQRFEADGSADYFVRDRQDMVVQVELKSGERCNRRVCRHCHNPLPANYGKSRPIFITVIGIVGAGKTVYLSQLLRGMNGYARKAGLSAIVTGPSVVNFRKANPVAAGQPLPVPTPERRLQQPLFYELVRDLGDNRIATETLVMYDVAGEVFTSEQLVSHYAPFVEHADGVVLLIDPLQFEVVSSVMPDDRERDNPAEILNVIHHIVSDRSTGAKCEKPFAICVSKADQIVPLLSNTLQDLLRQDVEGVRGPDGRDLPVFNAKAYNPLLREMTAFIQDHSPDLAYQLYTNYAQFAWFAFSALGCRVERGTRENGEAYQYPVGPVIPKRIEEPLLWLFHEFGFTGINAPVGPVLCPECGGEGEEVAPEERTEILRKGLFGIGQKVRTVNRRCTRCGNRWFDQQTDEAERMNRT
ncbi:MAG: hypothetical protein IJT94_10955 [Oscillibacter sp.]|nr:hypothetical protein [Oscillibacter sp.]